MLYLRVDSLQEALLLLLQAEVHTLDGTEHVSSVLEVHQYDLLTFS